MSAKKIVSTIFFASRFCFAASFGEPLQEPNPLTDWFETQKAFYDKVPAGKSAPLALSIRVVGDDFKLGDPIPVEFTLTNTGTVNFANEDCCQGGNRRRFEYRLTVQDATGQKVVDPGQDPPREGTCPFFDAQATGEIFNNHLPQQLGSGHKARHLPNYRRL